MMGLLVRRRSAAAALASRPCLSVVVEGILTARVYTGHNTLKVLRLLARKIQSQEFIRMAHGPAYVLANGRASFFYVTKARANSRRTVGGVWLVWAEPLPCGLATDLSSVRHVLYGAALL